MKRQWSLPGGDTLYLREKALIAAFAGRRDVLSTSSINGGYRRDLKWAFNHDCKENGRKDTPLRAPSYAGHMRLIASELGLDPARACGLSTAADMANVSVVTETFEGLDVTTAVTGGIDINGGRVGDPAVWHEGGGTINILLFIGAALTPGALARALVTCTEAKTAALQELLAPSLYSAGIATGSGTDGTVIVSNPDSPLLLTFAGKHCKLGELIGRCVLKAVKEALYLQTGLGPAQQRDIFRRLGRFGLTREGLLAEYPGIGRDRLAALSGVGQAVALASLLAHLLDQLNWGLIGPEDALLAGAALLDTMGADHRLPPRAADAGEAAQALLAAYKAGLAQLCRPE